MARIVELVTYPVKGCAGVSRSGALLTPAGLEHDRSFMVTDPDGTFRSQRKDPSMAVIRPDIDAGPGRLTLRAPGVDPVTVEVLTSAPRSAVTLFGRPYQGIDQGDAVAEWLSGVLGLPSRLMRVPPEHDRVTAGAVAGTAGYADGHACTLAALSSLDALNERIAEPGGEALPINRFRPNVVIDGWPEPHREDAIRAMTLGEAELGYAKLDIRCAVTTVDQETGRKAGPEPLRTLAGYRRAAEGGVAFGVKFAVLRPGKLSVGDEVIVSSWGESEL
ncbi:MOSC domain-containing protein [Amycolatopsis antarctica]|uniref:MOSC domain-containing protein n=1 Tax=Amycolatopsis antarctica TaxID=1854586 RepID=A0A263CZ49_9PSEU|nr:MOSC N-terminal beta barrel domain-containing protein [Amycolatopsis antarctica]OZM71450.1 MOSC domain-containing protein [Amycolatopsis antarctica]